MMALNVQVVMGLLVMAAVAKADPGQTTVAVEGTYLDTHDTFDFVRTFGAQYPDNPPVGIGRHTQLLTAVAATHTRGSGLTFGVRLGRIDGEEVMDDEPAVDVSYVLWTPGLQVGFLGESVGFEAGVGAVIASDGEVSPTVGVRGLFGDLTTADGDAGIWFETSLGEVDSLPEVSQFALGVGFESGLLRLRTGFEATNLPTHSPGDCHGCGIRRAADGGGFYVDATIKVGDLGVRLRGVAREDPRGLVGLNYSF